MVGVGLGGCNLQVHQVMGEGFWDVGHRRGLPGMGLVLCVAVFGSSAFLLGVFFYPRKRSEVIWLKGGSVTHGLLCFFTIILLVL